MKEIIPIVKASIYATSQPKHSKHNGSVQASRPGGPGSNHGVSKSYLSLITAKRTVH